MNLLRHVKIKINLFIVPGASHHFEIWSFNLCVVSTVEYIYDMCNFNRTNLIIEIVYEARKRFYICENENTRKLNTK